MRGLVMIRAQDFLQRIAGYKTTVAAAHDLHGNHPQALAIRNRQELLAEWLAAGHWIQRGEQRMQLIFLDGFLQPGGAVVAGDAEEPNHFLVPKFLESGHDAV